jgi:DNA-binding response OmpR family regulator
MAMVAPRTSLGRLLVVDDHRDSVDMVVEYFTQAGYEAFGAHNGPDALRMADLEQPDVVLLDIHMPGLSGIEVLQQLRRGRPALPIIMMSGAGDRELARSCLGQGAVDYVQKPFDVETLQRRVAAAVTGAVGAGTRPALEPACSAR